MRRFWAAIMAVIMIVTFAGCSSTATGMYADKSDFGRASNSEEAKIIRQSVTDYLGAVLVFRAGQLGAEAKPDSTQMAIYYDEPNDEFTVVFYGPFLEECANGARKGIEFYKAEFGDGYLLPFEVVGKRKDLLYIPEMYLSEICDCIYNGLHKVYGRETPNFKLAVAPVTNFDGNQYCVMEYVYNEFTGIGRQEVYEITEVGDEILGCVDLYQ